MENISFNCELATYGINIHYLLLEFLTVIFKLLPVNIQRLSAFKSHVALLIRALGFLIKWP